MPSGHRVDPALFRLQGYLPPPRATGVAFRRSKSCHAINGGNAQPGQDRLWRAANYGNAWQTTETVCCMSHPDELPCHAQKNECSGFASAAPPSFVGAQRESLTWNSQASCTRRRATLGYALVNNYTEVEEDRRSSAFARRGNIFLPAMCEYKLSQPLIECRPSQLLAA